MYISKCNIKNIPPNTKANFTHGILPVIKKIIAIKIKNVFSGYLFIDLDKNCIKDIDNLKEKLIEEILIVALICILFLLHLEL